jgi:hypothetical protein
MDTPSEAGDAVSGVSWYPTTAAGPEPEPDVDPAAISRPKEREEISFPGNIIAGKFGHHGTMCTSSFPGQNKAAWDELVAKADQGGLSTACVFLTAAEQGKHSADPEADGYYNVGEKVEMKDKGEDWRVGTVLSVRPLKVSISTFNFELDHERKDQTSWHDVRKISADPEATRALCFCHKLYGEPMKYGQGLLKARGCAGGSFEPARLSTPVYNTVPLHHPYKSCKTPSRAQVDTWIDVVEQPFRLGGGASGSSAGWRSPRKRTISAR